MGGAIVSQLTQMNIPYRVSEASGAIEVPADKVHELRLRLAQQGLPKGGAVGFELLDQEKFGISQFSEQVNYQRALEGELSRTIETIGPVKGARVHLAMPKPSLFVREQNSLCIGDGNCLPGRALDEGQISAIVHLVSSAVAGLPPGNVTLVDQGGHLLTHANTSGRDLNDAQLKYASDVEGRIQRRIEAILSPIVGNGNIHAQVTAQLDFASKEQTEEQYRPNGDESQAALRSRQLNESEQSGSGYPGSIPGALNQPAPANNAPISTPPANQNNRQQQASTTSNSGPRSTQRNETSNYEVNRTIRHTKMNVGDVQRLSVAVVVNYKTLPDGKPLPLSNEQMKQIEDLTREAMGFSEKRGDSLENVVNSPFNSSDESGGELPFWQQQAFIDQLLAPVAGCWYCWWRGCCGGKRYARSLTRRAEAMKAVQQQAGP
ncbi:flagellar basal-body MS-ring/collar protein FliF [Escherichia coli]